MTHTITRGRGARMTAAVAAAGALSLLTACGGGSDATDTTSSASTSAAATASGNKTIIVSPLALKIPAMQGLSEGGEGYGGCKA